MEITTALIQRFLDNNCSPEEAEQVYQYLLQHKEVLDQWLPDEEWAKFARPFPVPLSKSNAWFAKIEQETGPRSIPVYRRGWLYIATAACVAAIIGGTYFFSTAPAPISPTTQPVAINIPVNRDTLFRNTGRLPVDHILSDGTVITLYTLSSVVCQQPFDTKARNIHLHGEALFKVAKDPARPFTVFTQGFSTTALGTTFRIKAYDSSRTATVKLIEGKVVLRNLQKPGEPIYLEPGGACHFLQGSQQFQRVPAQAAAPPHLVVPTKVDGSISESATEIYFSNTPLTEVLSKVSTIYNISIDTISVRLEGRTFTGSFLKKQAVNDVLGTIAGLNDITITYAGNVYRLANQ